MLEVRTDPEWAFGHVAVAWHIHGGLLQQRMTEVPGEHPIALVCGSGYRASTAASSLKREGFDDVTNVLGGMSVWNAAGLPTTRD